MAAIETSSTTVATVAPSGKKGLRVGSYSLIEPLGAGGMGEVWLAQHQLLDRLAAVKLIRADPSSPGGSDQARKRFEREARATSALRSPHTIALYDFGVTDDRAFYYAMELLEGIGLDVLVERFGPLAPARAIHVLRGACESLGEAHQRGVIHRDVKPSNIFVCTMGLSRDFVKVLDFGLVKQVVSAGALTSLTASGAIAGTPAFMPPEAARGEFTAQTDVYALGCVAYWLVTGRLVFTGVTAFEIMLAHAHAEPESPGRHVQSGLPRAFEELIMGCLAKAPEKRPTVQQVMTSLVDLAAEEPWTSSQAEAWWDEHGEHLGHINLMVGEGQRERLRGDALARRERNDLGEEEREARVKAGLSRLQQHFVQSHIDMANLEMRIARIKQAATKEAFEEVFADLPDLMSAATPVLASSLRDTHALAMPSPRELGRPRADVLCVMTHLTRQCGVDPGKELRALVLMGYCVLELTGGSMASGIMQITCTALMGGLEIIIPWDMRVEMVSGGLLGAFQQEGTFAPEIPEGRTTIRLQGSAVMGLVVVRARRPQGVR